MSDNANFDVIPRDSTPGVPHPFESGPRDALPGPGVGDEHLHVQFYSRPKENPRRSAEEGRPIFEDKLYIAIEIPGDRTSKVDRPANDADKARFPRHWEAYERNQAAPLNGTPLEEWPAITAARRLELRAMNVQTIEDLAGVADAHVKNLGNDGHKLRNEAQAWLDKANEGASVQRMASELAKRDEEIEALKASMKEMRETMIPRGAVPADDAAKPRRGRPPKA